MNIPENIPTVTINGRKCLPSAEAAKLLGVVNETMAAMRCRAKSGQVEHPEYLTYGRLVYYPLDALQEHIDQIHGGQLPTRDHSPEEVPEGAVFLTSRQLMTRWQIGRARFFQMNKSPDFPQPVKMGRGNRYPIEAVKAYEAQMMGCAA